MSEEAQVVTGNVGYEPNKRAALTQTVDGRLRVEALAAQASGVGSGQATVATTATLIVPARAGRAVATIINEGTVDVRLGTSSVTTANGALLPGTKGSAIDVYGGAAVYGIVASGTQVVSYLEAF